MKTKYVKKILMCRPTNFQVSYVINPWMKPGSVNSQNALSQWQELKKALNSQNIEVETIIQDTTLPDMVFAADQAIIKNNNLVLSNFHYKERRGEKKHYQGWFEQQGFNIKQLPKNYYFEGSGECIWFGQTLFVGTGFRNSPHVCRFLGKYLEVEAICLELVNPRYYHLDTCLFVLNETTAFYYPQAFSLKSKRLLKKMIPNLISFTEEEVNNFAANSLATDHHVVVQTGNASFTRQIKDLGYTPVEVNVSEFMKSGGGIHCLTQVLKEAYE
jgi:N-dimethylarginine dimethylaminohydrolase